MKRIKFILALWGITSLFAGEGKIVKVNETVDIWYEAFGQKNDPACLLIMGAGGPGTFWSVDFCEKLAKRGFYVIRYDQRDTGFSTCFDFAKNPYTLLDMAKDAIGLLDALHIEKAHLVGLSMGGPISELIAIHDPKRIQSLALIATSSDFRPLHLSLSGLPPEEGALSSPKATYQKAMAELFREPFPVTKEDQLKQRVALWKVLNGDAVPLEEDKNREIQQQFFSRLKNPSALMNHKLAVMASESLIRRAPQQVMVPTAIFLGTEDPIFGPDHGEALSKEIRQSKYYSVQGMGHVLNSCFSDFLIDKIEENAKSSEKN